MLPCPYHSQRLQGDTLGGSTHGFFVRSDTNRKYEAVSHRYWLGSWSEYRPVSLCASWSSDAWSFAMLPVRTCSDPVLHKAGG